MQVSVIPSFRLRQGRCVFFLRRIVWSDEYTGVNSHNYIVLVNANDSEPHILSLLLGR